MSQLRFVFPFFQNDENNVQIEMFLILHRYLLDMLLIFRQIFDVYEILKKYSNIDRRNK